MNKSVDMEVNIGYNTNWEQHNKERIIMYYSYAEKRKQEIAKKINTFLTYNYGRINYKEFLNCDEADVISLINDSFVSYKEYKAKVNEINVFNKKTTDDLLDHLLNDIGVDEFTIFKTRKVGRGWTARTVRGDMYAHWRKVFNDIKKVVPPSRNNPFSIFKTDYVREIEYDNDINFKICIDCSKYTEDNVSELVSEVFKKVKEKVKSLEQEKANNDKRLKRYIELAKNEYPEVKFEDFITSKEFINAIEELAKEEYRKELEDANEEIDVTHGDGTGDCTWVVGEHRCECGNNRYYLELEGDALDGYFPYGQWC